MEGPVLGSFSYVKQSWDFSLFRNSNRLAGTFHWSEDPSTAWLVPSTAEDPLAENRFLQARKGELKIQRKNPGSALRTSLLAVEKKWAQYIASFPQCPSETTHPSPFTT